MTQVAEKTAEAQIVHIVGAGLAGCEAAFFLAEHGIRVHLHEMRPEMMTPAHRTGDFAELVCSNSLKSKNPHSPAGLLKSELRHAGSLILEAAEKNRIPAGEALGVSREDFSRMITARMNSHPLISVFRGEVQKPPERAITLIASGPLTSEALSLWLARSSGEKSLYFYDAIAPIIDAATIDPRVPYLANRYEKGEEEAYLNCPLTQEQYSSFIQALLKAEKVTPHGFEKEIFFQGCQPIEAIAESGVDSLRFGAMRPVGLPDPRTGVPPFALVQLRAENQARTAYNMVGFQTKLKYHEQIRIFRTLPGLEKAEFLRLGSIHRNTYLCAPRVLRADLSIKGQGSVFLAGQLAGVEGYMESAACGWLAALFIAQKIKSRPYSAPPINTALGALLRHLTGREPKNFQPSHVHFGLFELSTFDGIASLKKDESKAQLCTQAFDNFRRWWEKQSV